MIQYFRRPIVFGFLGSIFCAGAFFVGCSSQSTDRTPIRQVIAKKTGEIRKDQKITGTRVRPPKEAEALFKALEVSHQVFSQFWIRYWEEKQEIGSPFGALRKRLLTHVSEGGGWNENQQASCPKQQSKIQLQWRDEKKTKPESLEYFVAPDCSPNAVFESAARVDFLESGARIRMTRAFFVDGFGLSLATLGKNAEYELGYSQESSLLKISKSKGLGQNRSVDLYLELSTFEYDQKAHHLLNVKGSKFDQSFQKTCEEKEGIPCIDFTATLDGKIKVQENPISSQERELYEKELLRSKQGVSKGPSVQVKTSSESLHQGPSESERKIRSDSDSTGAKKLSPEPELSEADLIGFFEHPPLR